MSSVLIAEGEPRIASFVKKGLDNAGFATLVASDGDEALALVRRVPFDVIVLDASLAVHRPTLVEELRAGIPRVVVVILTKIDLVEAATESATEGADAYLRKPFRVSELVDRLRRHVDDSHTSRPAIVRRHGATFDRHSRSLTFEGKTRTLTNREATLVDLVLRDADRELTDEQLRSRLRSLLT